MLGVAAIVLTVLGLTREVSCAVASGENQYIVEYANVSFLFFLLSVKYSRK